MIKMEEWTVSRCTSITFCNTAYNDEWLTSAVEDEDPRARVVDHGSLGVLKHIRHVSEDRVGRRVGAGRLSEACVDDRATLFVETNLSLNTQPNKPQESYLLATNPSWFRRVPRDPWTWTALVWLCIECFSHTPNTACCHAWCFFVLISDLKAV